MTIVVNNKKNKIKNEKISTGLPHELCKEML